MSTPRSALFCTYRDCTAAKLRVFALFYKKLSTFYFPRKRYTRMEGQWNLSATHAKPEVTLPEGTCSHITCQPHKLSSHTVHGTSCRGQHPIDRTENPFNPARAPAESIPDWPIGRICHPCARRWQSFCQLSHAGTECAHRAILPFRAFPFLVRGYGVKPHVYPWLLPHRSRFFSIGKTK